MKKNLIKKINKFCEIYNLDGWQDSIVASLGYFSVETLEDCENLLGEGGANGVYIIYHDDNKDFYIENNKLIDEVYRAVVDEYGEVEKEESTTIYEHLNNCYFDFLLNFILN